MTEMTEFTNLIRAFLLYCGAHDPIDIYPTSKVIEINYRKYGQKKHRIIPVDERDDIYTILRSISAVVKSN